MNRSALNKRVPDSIELGSKFSYRRTLTDGDVALFIGATWDVNPLHTDDVYAEGTDFGGRIVPGLLTASLLTHLGGLWAFMATRTEFTFTAPVYIGETITAEAEIVEYEPERGWVRLKCRCVNRAGKDVLQGDVEGYPGSFRLEPDQPKG
jgi:3-hydroxybutyryl-CoA dehydratase